MKVHAKTLKVQGTKRTMDDTTSERKVKPLPSQNCALMANAPLFTANPRPLKWQCIESWEEQYLAEDLHQGQLYTISQDDLDNDVGEEYIDDDLFQAHLNVMDFQLASRFYAHQYICPHHMHDHAPHRAPPSFHDIAQGGLLPSSAHSLDCRPFPPSWSAHPQSSHVISCAVPARPAIPGSTSQQAVAGSSCLGPAELQPCQAYYHKKLTNRLYVSEMDY